MTQSQKSLGAMLRAWIPAGVWMAIIFALSAQSHPPFMPPGEMMFSYGIRKLGHFTEYAILAWLIYRPLREQTRGAWLAFALTALYGASDEWHQSFVPGREMLLGDWLIDSAGAVCGLFIARQGYRWLARRGARK